MTAGLWAAPQIATYRVCFLFHGFPFFSTIKTHLPKQIFFLLLLHVNALNYEEFRSTFERLWSVLFWTWGCNFPNQLVFDSFMIEKNQSYNFFAGFGTFSIRGICLSFFFAAADLLEMLFPSASKFLAFFRQNFRIPPRGTSCAGSTEEVPSPRCPCFVQSTQGRASVRPRA